MKFYCLKERKHVVVPEFKVNYKVFETKTGKKRKQARAICPNCGTKVCKFVSMKK